MSFQRLPSHQIRDWCGYLNRVFKSTTNISSIPRVYHKAFDFFYNRKGPAVELSGGFRAPDPNGTSEWIRFEGLTSQLSRVFHPLQLDVSTGGSGTGGSVRGMAVDREFEILVNHPNESERELSILHDYTIRAASILMERKLRPFMAQVPVALIELSLATSLDLLCVDENTGGLVNVQLKTGFENRDNYDRASRTMFFHSPFVPRSKIARIKDSHKNRHMLQVVVEHMIVQMGHENPLEYSMLMVVSSNVVSCFPVPGSHTESFSITDIYKNLLERTDESALDAAIHAVRAQFALREVRSNLRRSSSFAYNVRGRQSTNSNSSQQTQCPRRPQPHSVPIASHPRSQQTSTTSASNAGRRVRFSLQ